MATSTIVFRGETLDGTQCQGFSVATTCGANVIEKTSDKRITAHDTQQTSAPQTPLTLSTAVTSSDAYWTIIRDTVLMSRLVGKSGVLQIHEGSNYHLLSRHATLLSVSPPYRMWAQGSSYQIDYQFLCIEGGGGMVFFDPIVNGGFEDLNGSAVPRGWTVGDATLTYLDALPFGSGMVCMSLDADGDDPLIQTLSKNSGYDSDDFGDYYFKLSWDAFHPLSTATQDTASLTVEFRYDTGDTDTIIATAAYSIVANKPYHQHLVCKVLSIYDQTAPYQVTFRITTGSTTSNILIDNVRLEEVYETELY